MLGFGAIEMNRSTGGEQLQQFEGLVHTTARMFASKVGREEHDLAQELRIRVWRAAETFNARKSAARGPDALRRYVYSAVANKVKDYKRDAAREARRREEHGISFVHIEDTLVSDAESAAERFDDLHHYVEHDEVYGRVDEGEFILPAGVTERESHVLLCLTMQMSKAEIALRLGVTRQEVDVCVLALREKFADWKPDSSPPVELVAAVAA